MKIDVHREASTATSPVVGSEYVRANQTVTGIQPGPVYGMEVTVLRAGFPMRST